MEDLEIRFPSTPSHTYLEVEHLQIHSLLSVTISSALDKISFNLVKILYHACFQAVHVQQNLQVKLVLCDGV